MQAEELSYVIVTPYSMRKSRTGGIVSRLISRTGLDLVGGRMFAPGEELVRRYTEEIVTAKDPRHRATQELIRDYVRKNFTGERDGQRPRVLLLVFRGPDAVEKIRHVVGHIVHERTSGETIRDTYGDYVTDEAGKVTYFEPGVLASLDAESVEENLKLWAEFSDSDGGILDRVITYPAEAKVEKSLVLIKPDNFKFPNIRPGGVIEVFSRTGLYIIGFKVHRMSVAQAEEFYGPVLPVLEDKLGASKGRERVGRHRRVHVRQTAQRDERRSTPRARHREVHRDRLPGRRRGPQNPRGPRADRSKQGATRFDPEGIRPDNHGQRRPRFRFGRKRANARWESSRSTRITSNL